MTIEDEEEKRFMMELEEHKKECKSFRKFLCIREEHGKDVVYSDNKQFYWSLTPDVDIWRDAYFFKDDPEDPNDLLCGSALYGDALQTATFQEQYLTYKKNFEPSTRYWRKIDTTDFWGFEEQD